MHWLRFAALGIVEARNVWQSLAAVLACHECLLALDCLLCAGGPPRSSPSSEATPPGHHNPFPRAACGWGAGRDSGGAERQQLPAQHGQGAAGQAAALGRSVNEG
jgi:hypothetical protein